MRYDGPIIDAHTHLWDLSMGKHPWLAPSGGFGPPGRLDQLKGKDYLLEHYRADIDGVGVVASTHVEALWDAASSPVEETAWLESLDGGLLASRYVGGAVFGRADTEEILRAQASYERMRGVRQVIAWTPDPNRRMAATEGIARGGAWRAALPVLRELDLHLELLIYPHQAQDVAALAADYPDLPIVVNHIGSPIEQDEAGVGRWRAAIDTLAAHPNTFMKLSAAAAYPAEKSVDAMRPFVVPIVETFGADRVMWGSDFPVGTLVGWSYGRYLEAYRRLLDQRTPAEQAAILFGTANRLYRFGL
ncbi:amidohydrolase family protein [Microbacterium sp. CPCC 204701]|uniref:amidohydrolase family protein n=1 Tax=Microbacterium sp. CPCC 204701 TaxID=2493084 RepID=UPI0013E2AD08|nr:amidohydrolase family protein [Microbacterium sp. CPCC 204701]